MDAIPFARHDLTLSTIIEVDLVILVSKMSESIPLRARLCVESKNVIIYCSGLLVEDVLLE